MRWGIGKSGDEPQRPDVSPETFEVVYAVASGVTTATVIGTAALDELRKQLGSRPTSQGGGLILEVNGQSV